MSPTALLAAGVFFATATAQTVVREASLEALVDQSEIVVRATADESQPVTSEDGRQIHTVTRVTVRESLKGEALETLEVRTPGGTVGEITQVVHGAPRLEKGEEVVLFLQRAAPGTRRFVVHGLSQGKFKVVKDQTGAPVVTRDRAELQVVGPDGHPRPLQPAEPVSERVFLDRVRELASRKASP